MSEKLYFQKIPLSQVGTALTSLELGYPIVLVADDEPIIAIAKVVTPQLLITDIMMPGMSGIDLALRMKLLQPACRTILFSGHIYHEQFHTDPRCADLEFSVLPKPIHPDLLLAHISGIHWAVA